jgi:hypothetical protein
MTLIPSIIKATLLPWEAILKTIKDNNMTLLIIKEQTELHATCGLLSYFLIIYAVLELA